MTRVPDKTKRAAEDLAKKIQEAITKKWRIKLHNDILDELGIGKNAYKKLGISEDERRLSTDRLTINDKGEVFRIKFFEEQMKDG